MPYPSDKISASILVCEKILRESDGVNSAIRIVDVLHVPERPAGWPEDALPLLQPHALILIKAVPGYYGKHSVRVSLINTVGEVSTMTPSPLETNFKSRLGEDVPGGMTINLQLNLVADRLGTCYVSVEIDGEEANRVPITLRAARTEAGNDLVETTTGPSSN